MKTTLHNPWDGFFPFKKNLKAPSSIQDTCLVDGTAQNWFYYSPCDMAELNAKLTQYCLRSKF